MRLVMKTGWGRRTAYGLLGVFCILAGVYFMLRLHEGQPAPAHIFFAGDGVRRPLVIAHRGGRGLWPENTLYAFERARGAGADVLEMDLRATRDGALVIMHDPTVERTTDGRGPVSALTLEELKRLDAGYQWTPDNGQSFPHRGQGVTVPTLAEVFSRLGDARFVVEIKQDEPPIHDALCREVREHGLAARVLVASFRQSALDDFRRVCPEVATSAGATEGWSFLAMFEAGLGDSYSPDMQALQVPERIRGLRVVTGDFIAAAHRRNLEVHAWTINDSEDMRRLIDLGIDGIITDYPDRLAALRDQTPPR